MHKTCGSQTTTAKAYNLEITLDARPYKLGLGICAFTADLSRQH